MSTYTDYRCERKENVTILRKPGCPEFDGFTPQKVIFGNEANYFKGTFEGKVIAKDMALSGVEINDCTINGGLLVDTTLCSDGQKITLTELTSQVSNIDENIGKLSVDVNELKTKSSSISASISESLSAVSSNIITTVNELVETSCEKLCTDISAVSSEILYTVDAISSEIISTVDAISNVLSTEINERILADNYISGQLSTLSTDFSEHVFQNKEDFKYMEKFVLSSLEQDKHYQIYESKIVTESVPYKLHDFGINIVEDRIGNSILKLDEQPIGYATQYTLDGDKYIDIHIENTLENAVLSSVVPNTYHIVLKLNESKTIEYNSGLYSITYQSPSDETYVLNIKSTATEYIKVFRSGELIGTITDFEYLDSDAKTLLSGILHIVYNSNATNFCDFYGAFDGNMFTFTDTVRDIFDPDRKLRIQFNTDGKSFLYEKNVSEKHFTYITSNDGTGDIGRVYQDTYISADDGHLSLLVFESSHGLGTATISEDSSYIGFFSDSSHIVKLDSDNVFKIYEANTFYRYEFSSGGDNPAISGFIKPSNHQPLNDENESLSVTITAKVLDDGEYAPIDNTYVLAKDPTKPSWIFVNHDDSTGQFISIKYESNVLAITGNFGGIALESGDTYVIDESAGIHAYSDEMLIVTSTETTFDFIDVSLTSPEKDRFYAYIDDEVTSFPTLTIPDILVEDIPLEEQYVRYEIPAKKTEYYGCSREFIIASKIFASTPDVEIRFSCDGTDIKIQDDHGLTTFTQPSNTLVVMKVNEIGQNSFLVTYLTHDKINSWINELSTSLSTEISNRISADDALSIAFDTKLDDEISNRISAIDALSIEFNTKLDEEISNRISAIDALSIEFNTKLDDEISTRIKIDGELSAQISANINSITDLWKNIRGGLNYAGNLCIDIEKSDHVEITTISALIYENIHLKDKDAGETKILSTRFREGFFFVLEASSKTYRRILDGHELEHGDWLIINSNNELSALTSADVNVFDAQDYDSFRLSNDNVISGNNVFNGSLAVNASTTFNGLVEITTTLSSNSIYVNDGVSAAEFIATESIRSKSISSELLDSNGVKSETLSVDLSAKIDKAYVNSLTSTIGDVSSLTSETVSITKELTSPAISGTNVSSENLTVENANIDILNNTISAEFPKANINDATVEELSATSLTSDNASISTVIASSVTATTLLSANEIASPSISATTIEVSVEYASYASISTAEVTSLCVASNATIENLDATHSTINELSADDLSVDYEYVKQSNIENLSATWVEISSTNISCATIKNLSIDFDNIVNAGTSSKYKDINQFITSVELSVGSISVELSNRISTDIKISGDLSTLSVQVSKDVEYLSSELSDYHNTLSGIDRLSHTPDTISTDNLMITDVGLVIEGTKHPMYYMTMISGSIVLKKIS